MLASVSPFLKDLPIDPWDRTPTEVDCEWLLDTINSLCAAAKQSCRYHEIARELIDRGFIPEDTKLTAHTPPPRMGSPFPQVYTELEEIGEGGYGKVYKVQNLIENQVYALKAITLTEPEVTSAVREVQCLAHLNSPRIVRYYSSWLEEQDDSHMKLFIQMELVHGQSLSDYLSQRAEVDVPFMMKTIAELAKALAEIHAAGIVHRDFKPANIMLREEGGVCVIDFGIASMKTARFSPPPETRRVGSLTEVDRMCIHAANSKHATVREVGTPLYSSPSQLNGMKSGPKDDIYSFGIMMLEMLSEFTTNMEKAKAIRGLRRERVIPEEFSTRYPDIAKMILQMTDNKAQNRPSADEVLQIVDGFY